MFRGCSYQDSVLSRACRTQWGQIEFLVVVNNAGIERLIYLSWMLSNVMSVTSGRPCDPDDSTVTHVDLRAVVCSLRACYDSELCRVIERHDYFIFFPRSWVSSYELGGRDRSMPREPRSRYNVSGSVNVFVRSVATPSGI